MKFLKSRAMNAEPLSEITRGRASGYCSLARCELLGDLGDDAVFAPQSSFERLDLTLELLLATGGGSLGRQGLGGVVEELALPLVEDAGLELVLVTEVGDRDLVGEVPTQDGGLVLGGEAAAFLSWAHGTPRDSVFWSLLESVSRGTVTHLGMVVILANLLRQIGAFCPAHHVEQQEALASLAGIAQLYDRTESMAWQRRDLDFVREMGRLMEALQEPEQPQ